jgi:hypothetical protein
MTGKASDEEAAWRELVAQFGMPAADDSPASPWPPSEDLPTLAPPHSPDAETPADPPGATTPAESHGGQAPTESRDRDFRGDPPGTSEPAGAENSTGSGDTDSTADPPGAETPAESGGTQTPAEPPVTELPASAGPVPGVIPAPPQFRIIRPALPSPPPDTDDDERYVPPDPPPLPQLDPAAKLAWAALFGGPGYLLVAVVAGWQVSGVAGLIAVAAFVGGFATLIIRMGDRPPGDSGPDDGAVV